MFVVIFALLWIRSTWPRLRVDQIMGFAWKILMELGFVNIFLIAVEVAILMDPVTGILTSQDMLIMAGINWVFTIITLVFLANFLGKRNYDRPDPVPSPLANMQPKGE